MQIPEPQTQVVSVADCDLRYLRVGSGPTVLMLHTLRTQLEYFGPLIDAIGPGFELVAPDLPGHGRSSAPAVEYTATFFTEVIADFLNAADLQDVIVVGESIGASIGLALAARQPARFRHVLALNTYDYGWGGGIRRSSKLANLLVTPMLLPGIGSLVFAVRTKGMVRNVLRGGFHDPRFLSPRLVDELWVSGELPGHPPAFLSLLRQWRTWLEARALYPAITTPVTLVYSEHDWSNEQDRAANARHIPTARRRTIERCGHFSCLERPSQVANVVREVALAS